jgi:hypothetical protein
MLAPTRLGLERLGDRNAPSSLVGNAVATTDWLIPKEVSPLPAAYIAKGTPPAQNQPPAFASFEVVVGSGSVGTFRGTVTDENPANLTVTLSGAPLCVQNGVTVTTDANGNFEFQGNLRTVLDCGRVYADVSDAQGLAAESAEFLLDV